MTIPEAAQLVVQASAMATRGEIYLLDMGEPIKILDLAKRDNAIIKVSGAGTLSKAGYPYPDIWDPLARIFDAWGFERCLWGTDWTRAAANLTYAQGVEPFRTTDRLSDSERAMLMGGACARTYGWTPS